MRITFFCPTALEKWGPDSITETGIGGSEAAVILMAKQVADLGHEVDVYALCDPQTKDGVTYRSFESLTKTSTDVLIILRVPAVITPLREYIQSKRTYLWMHDMLPEDELLPFLDSYDRILVLSAFHRQAFPSVPDAQIFQTRNGIDTGFIQEQKKPKRNPWGLVYCSNYDRGLILFTDHWDALKKEFPKLELTIMYGWQTLEALMQPSDVAALKERIEPLFAKKDVHHLGRVSQPEVIKQLCGASIFAYPCMYPETSCIAAMQAQACGAVPVVIPSGALQETVQFGYKTAHRPEDLGSVNNQLVHEYLDALRAALRDQEKTESLREPMIQQSQDYFSWEGVAREWVKELFN